MLSSAWRYEQLHSSCSPKTRCNCLQIRNPDPWCRRSQKKYLSAGCSNKPSLWFEGGKHGKFLHIFLKNRWVGFVAFLPPRGCFLSWPVSVKFCRDGDRWFTAGTRGNLERQQKKGVECSHPGLLSQVGFAAKENKQVDVNTASLQVGVAQAGRCKHNQRSPCPVWVECAAPASLPLKGSVLRDEFLVEKALLNHSPWSRRVTAWIFLVHRAGAQSWALWALADTGDSRHVL